VPIAVASVVLGLFPSDPGLGQQPSAIPAFPAQADAITADVVVLDDQGRPVRGLTREDFTLLADGKPQTIVAFEVRDLATAATSRVAAVGSERVATNEGGAAQGRTFAFLIDDFGDDLAKRHFQWQEAKRAIAQWLQEKAHPADELTLATASGDLWWSDRIDRGRTDFLAVLDRVRIRGTLGRVCALRADHAASSRESTGAVRDMVGNRGAAAGAPDPNRGLDQEIADGIACKTLALLAATDRLSRGLTGARGRKSIVIFSDGFPNDPNQSLLFDRTVDASLRANTAVYFVDVKGLGAPGLFRAEDRNGVTAGPGGNPNVSDLGVRRMEADVVQTSGAEMVAEYTGGTSIRHTNDLLGGVDRIAEESSTYYLLGYQPAEAPDGRWHTLEVRVARPGAKIRTRRGYQAAPPHTLVSVSSVSKGKTTKQDDKNGATRPVDPAALTSGASDALPLRIASYVLETDKAGLARLLVVLELDTSRLTLHGDGRRRTGAIDLTLVGMSRDLARMFPLDERVQIDLDARAAGGWMSLTRELRLPSGVAQVRALVRDAASGLGGTVTQRLEVPALDAPYLATPVLTNRIIIGRGETARLVPLAHRRFRPQGFLYCSYEVVGMTNARGEATTRVAGGFTLRKADGQIISQSSPTPIAVALGGRVARLFALPLSGLAAGDYELVLDVVDENTGRTLQSHEAFILG
jgi:VWFA-related protein